MTQIQTDFLYWRIVAYTLDLFPDYLMEAKWETMGDLLDVYEKYCWSNNPYYILLYCSAHHIGKYDPFWLNTKKEA